LLLPFKSFYYVYVKLKLLGQLYCTITRGDLLKANNYVSHHYSLDKQASLPGAATRILLRGEGLKIEKNLRRHFDVFF